MRDIRNEDMGFRVKRQVVKSKCCFLRHMNLGRGIFQEIKAGELGGSRDSNKPLLSC